MVRAWWGPGRQYTRFACTAQRSFERCGRCDAVAFKSELRGVVGPSARKDPSRRTLVGEAGASPAGLWVLASNGVVQIGDLPVDAVGRHATGRAVAAALRGPGAARAAEFVHSEFAETECRCGRSPDVTDTSSWSRPLCCRLYVSLVIGTSEARGLPLHTTNVVLRISPGSRDPENMPGTEKAPYVSPCEVSSA